MTKTIFNFVFITLIGIFLIVLNEFDLLQSGVGFAIIPIALSYLVGQYSERRFKDE